MENLKSKAGRKAVPVELRKKNRGISFTDAEYARLVEMAEAAGFRGPSAFLVFHHKLSKKP